MDLLEYYQHPELYDRISHPSPAMADHYLALARESGGPVLELACGTGRLTVPFAQAGIDIAGVDVSPAMLRVAREKAKAAGVAVDFIEADMRSFDLGRRFALIYIAFNSLLHLLKTEDIRACFARVREHLAPGGMFAIDVFNPHVGKLAREPGVRIGENRTDDSSGELSTDAAFDYDSAAQVNRVTWYVSAPGRPDLLVVPLHLRCIFPQELPLLLELAGLTMEARYGDFARGPFASASETQVVVARVAER